MRHTMRSEKEPNPKQRPRLRGCWNALKKLSYGVYVVAARCGEGESTRVNAMTARFLSQISTRPPRIALTLSKTRLTHDLLLESGAFAVSILAEGQELLGGHFGLRSGREVNKLAQVEYFDGERTGAPILNECSAWFECRVEAVHDMGACSLIVAEVLSGGTRQSEPLVYRESDYFG
jgi:flavin reductase (DIM6/NTAB) family NADH-FMN oxidoreductase RutF